MRYLPPRLEKPDPRFDPVLGAHFLRLAAEQGYPDGLFWYGLCWCEGRGTHPDPATGKQLIVRAAAEGNYDAQEWLDEQQAPAE